MSNDNHCSIKLKPFWLPQLPVTLEQALSYKKKIGQCYFCNSDKKYGVTTYLNFLSIGNFCSMKLKSFWLSELLVILDNKLKTTKTKDLNNISNQIQNYLLTSFSWVVLTSAVSNWSHSDYLNLPVTLDNKFSDTKKNGQSFFVILANKYGITLSPE